MLLSLSLILLLGLLLSQISIKLKLPGLIGMLLTGIILGPFALDLIDSSILNISSQLRKIALVIIIIRAGLSLDIDKLKKVGRPALLMCFVPASCEIAAIIVLAPLLLDVTSLEAAILGTVLAAVSPAVIVPRMIKLIEEGYGTNKSIPQMIMAGASVDDIFVIILFSSFTGLAKGTDISPLTIANIPISIISGLFLGIIIGIIMTSFFKNIHMRDSAKIIIMLSVSFILIWLESVLEGTFAISGLLAVMSFSATLFRKHNVAAKRLSQKFSKLWVCAEILLFVLVGAAVDPSYVKKAGIACVALILIVLLFRIAGVFLCVAKTKLSKKERLFCSFSYLPKATVQAAIGGLPLAMELPCGELVLTVAVMSIIITAPLGAFLIDMSYGKFLTNS